MQESFLSPDLPGYPIRELNPEEAAELVERVPYTRHLGISPNDDLSIHVQGLPFLVRHELAEIGYRGDPDGPSCLVLTDGGDSLFLDGTSRPWERLVSTSGIRVTAESVVQYVRCRRQLERREGFLLIEDGAEISWLEAPSPPERERVAALVLPPQLNALLLDGHFRVSYSAVWHGKLHHYSVDVSPEGQLNETAGPPVSHAGLLHNTPFPIW